MSKRPTARAAAFEALRRSITLAMLVALYVVLNRFVSISLPGAKIGFSVVCPMLAAMLYGPFSGALVYGLGDFISAMLFPFGVYHPGFTVTAAAMGFIWGLICHPHPLSLYYNDYLDASGGIIQAKSIRWALAPALVNCLVLGLLVNTEWVAQLYGSRTYPGWLLYRLPEYVIMVPVNVFLAGVCMPLSSLMRKKGFVQSLPRKKKTV